MEKSEVVEKIKQVLPDAQVEVDGADCSFSALVISDQFTGMLPVKRQQLVLGCFSDLLSTGELHALSVKAHTPTEWDNIKGQSLTQLM